MNFIFNKFTTHLCALKAGLTTFLMVVTLTVFAQNQLPGKIHFGIIYPLSTNGAHAALDTNNLSFNLIAGVSAAERGLAFAGLTNIVRHDTRGILFSGFSNHVAKKAEGGLFAGMLNTYGSGQGAAFAGFANISGGDVNGGQFAGFTNFAKDLKGAQLAGFMNIANQVTGSQLAGFINVAKDVSASQFAGFINKAKDVKGSQFSGFINVAKKVKGAQIAAFINVADSSDFPIGFINIVKNGEKSIGVSTDENLTTMLTFRSGGKVLYGIIGIGYNFKNSKEVYAYQVGLGAHFFSSKSFRLNTELTSSSLESFGKGQTFKSSLSLMPALKLTPFLEIFAGPSLNFLNADTYEGRKLQKKYIKSWESKYGNSLNALYAGYSGGIHFIF